MLVDLYILAVDCAQCIAIDTTNVPVVAVIKEQWLTMIHCSRM